MSYQRVCCPPSPIKHAFARSYETAGGHCWPVLSFSGNFLMPCQNGHWGHILPHVEIVGRDLPVCKDITADGGFTATNIQFIT